jgi:uncharacterized protein YecT (DUF1311 family)
METEMRSRFTRSLQAAILLCVLVIANGAAASTGASIPTNDDVCNGRSTTREMLDCLSDATGKADRALQTLYDLVIRELSSGTSDSRYSYEDDKRDLIEAEGVWIRFRDTQCLIEEELMEPGTGAPLENAHCFLVLTNERIRFLSRYQQQISFFANLCRPDESKCVWSPPQ